MITYQEILENAKKNMNDKCKHCNVCDGVACKGVIPGPGAKGTADSFTRCYQKLQEIKINIDTIYEAAPIDPRCDFFGRMLKYPLMAAPIGSVDAYFGEYYDDKHYAMELLTGCRDAGIAAFTADGPKTNIYYDPMDAVKASGCGIPTFKPRNLEDAKVRIRTAEDNNAIAVAIDIDAVGLAVLRNLDPPVQPKSTEQLAEIISLTQLPVIVKGIMTVGAAEKAIAAGAAAIVVSTHGGRVMDQLPAAVEVLPAIVEAVNGRVKIIVDGGVRSGLDIFKLLALGADMVLIGRPYVTAAYGGGAEGVALYTEKIGQELVDAMYMTGATTVKNINKSMLYWPERQLY